MNISFIQATNIELTEAIRSYVEKRVEAFEKLTQEFEPAAELRVEVGKTSHHHAKGEVFYAEINLSIPGTLLRAEETTEDLYKAIDAAKENILRQLKDYKTRLQDRDQKFPRPGKE